MRLKQQISTGEIYKWKAHLNIDGSKQTKGVNYWETYAPVASWLVIRLILIMVITQGWKTWNRQIDYIQTYNQAKEKTDLFYMKIPKGFTISKGVATDYVLQINKNIYGQKQAGRVWYQHLVKKFKAFTLTSWRGWNFWTIQDKLLWHSLMMLCALLPTSMDALPTKCWISTPWFMIPSGVQPIRHSSQLFHV